MKYTKKQPYTDLAISGWRFFFQYPDFLDDVFHKTNERSVVKPLHYISDPTANTVIHQDELLRRHKVKIADWQAAKNALNKLDNEDDGNHKVNLLRRVYGVTRDDSVGSRVLRASLDMNVSEPTAWRWLRSAHLLWAKARGVA